MKSPFHYSGRIIDPRLGWKWRLLRAQNLGFEITDLSSGVRSLRPLNYNPSGKEAFRLSHFNVGRTVSGRHALTMCLAFASWVLRLYCRNPNHPMIRGIAADARVRAEDLPSWIRPLEASWRALVASRARRYGRLWTSRALSTALGISHRQVQNLIYSKRHPLRPAALVRGAQDPFVYWEEEITIWLASHPNKSYWDRWSKFHPVTPGQPEDD